MINKLNFVSFLFVLSVLLGCQQLPTRVTESRSYPNKYLTETLGQPIKINESTVILDARSRFDFGMVRLPGSHNLQWEDFTDSRGGGGHLKTNYQQMASRLAVLGISPDTEVVVIGYGRGGHGEEGRLAWTLMFLGLQKVRFADSEYFKVGWTNHQSPPKQASAPFWKPDLRPVLVAEREEVVRGLVEPTAHQVRHVIDVRSEQEYFARKQDLSYEVPNAQLMNIEWKEFLTEDGLPNPKIKSRLRAIGVDLGDEIILASNKGVRSAAATVALQALGFSRARNYAGGFNELLKLRR